VALDPAWGLLGSPILDPPPWAIPESLPGAERGDEEKPKTESAVSHQDRHQRERGSGAKHNVADGMP
jgi:hypothetical protein